MMKNLVIAVVFLGLLAVGSTAQAVPFVSGQINFFGTITTSPAGGLNTATSLTIVPNPLVADPVTGDFAVIPAFPPLSSPTPAEAIFFGGAISLVGFPPTVDFWTVTDAGLTYHFDLASLVVTTQNVNFLSVSGTGFMYVTDAGSNLVFASTPSVISLTAQNPLGNPNATYSFSATAAAEAVPEPGTLLLIGTGLTGLALRRRRRQ